MFNLNKILFKLILISGINATLFSQTQNTIAAMNNYDQEFSNYTINDVNNDGKSEILKGFIVNQKNNTYWVKSGNLSSEDGEIIITFGTELMVNNQKAIEQVPARNGYILEFVKDKKDNKYLIFLGIADEFGEKYSDELIIDLAN